MDQLILNTGFPILSVMVFMPLAFAMLLFFVKSDSGCRWITLIATAFTAIFSLTLVAGFDKTTSAYQFVEMHTWVESPHIQYALGVDGISILLVLMNTSVLSHCSVSRMPSR